MDIALKQRLVGAIVLIALAVVVLPMLLSGRPEQAGQEAQKIELPPQPADLDFQTRRFPVQDSTVRKQADPAAEPGKSLPPLPQPGPAAVRVPESTGDVPADQTADQATDQVAGPIANEGPGPVAQVEVPPRDFEDALASGGEPSAATPDPQAATGTSNADSAGEPAVENPVEPPNPTPVAAASAGGRYAVQVASFGSIANANRLAETLRGEGYAVLTDTVKSDVGTLHRVRVGPYLTEAEANGAVNRIRKQMADVQPRIVDLQPEQAAAVTSPSDPLVRWVVQVGSFSSAENAERLVQQLRQIQLSAYSEAVSAAGATIHRVRVGPYVDRDEAMRADALILERIGLDGVVMSAD